MPPFKNEKRANQPHDFTQIKARQTKKTST